MSEDLRPSGDITTKLIKNNKKIKVKIIANENCIVGGLNFAKEAFKYTDKKVKFNKVRKSIATYYLIPLKEKKLINRQKALYAPVRNQIGNKKILKFIKIRSSSKTFSKVYKTKRKR